VFVMPIRSHIRDYSVSFEDDPSFIGELAATKDACWIVDANVWELYRQSALAPLAEADVAVMPFDETRKNLETVTSIYDRLVEKAAKRNLTLISVGGGITQDVTGFAASTLYRGVRWIFVPTTLLAQADSCIGGKTSLNYRAFKNLVGSFYPPSHIHLYTPFLRTLTEEDYASGLGEVIKLYLMGGLDRQAALRGQIDALFARDDAALRQSVAEALRIKISYMEDDEFDTGKRNLLNYGHTLGHALESVSNYRIPHGQAVIIGMVYANAIASERGRLAPAKAAALAVLLRRTLTARPTGEDLTPEPLLDAMRKDKKRCGQQLPLIMLQDDGSLVRVNDLTEQEARAGLTQLGHWLLLEGNAA